MSKDFNPSDVDLIRFGRHFFYPELVEGDHSIQIILGRDREENELLKNQTRKDEIFIIPINFSGPEALIRGHHISEENIAQAKELIIKFASKAKNLKKESPVFSMIKGQPFY